jgi:hypothetical protein
LRTYQEGKKCKKGAAVTVPDPPQAEPVVKPEPVSEPEPEPELEPLLELEPEPTEKERNEGGDWGFSSI